MSTLENRLNAIHFPNQLVHIKTLMDTAEAKTTFWGGRIVEFKGSNDSVGLEFIAKKILEAGRQRCDADDLTVEERIAGVEIVRKLQDFYKITDTQIKHSNCFTRLLNWLREFHIFPYSTRFHIDENAEAQFLAYSEERFTAQFGWNENADIQPGATGSFGPPLRIVASEDTIRALLNHP